MPRKQEWTVRVVNWQTRNEREDKDGPSPLQWQSRARNELPGVWVEQLRYMGHVRELADYDNRSVLEFYCPKGLDSRIWAQQNADRMQSFGLDAAAAPKWDGSGEKDALGTHGGPTSLQAHMERHNHQRGRP